jgi:lactate dehydrogenase-like 2-hydroxyacid dehydrogenase
MESASRDELFKDLAPGGRYADIAGIYHEHESHHKIGLPDNQMIYALPPSVKWIAHKGAGYDQFDVASCKARGTTILILLTQLAHVDPGINLSNTPGAVDDATATTAIYLLIATMRNFSICERSLRAGTFKPHIEGASHDLSGRTLGILGLGSIGIRFAEMARPFRMRIVYHNRRKVQNSPEYCEYFENLEEMLKVVDVLSVHVPLTPETVGFVGEKMIRTIKPGGVIINTARGKIIDEEAMLRALEDGHVSLKILSFIEKMD